MLFRRQTTLRAASPPEGAPGPPLIFDWEPRGFSVNKLLLAMLFFSLLGHAASFYALQAFYTPAVALPPPAVQWTVLPPGSAENAQLWRWLAVADPALAARGPLARQSAEKTLAQLPFRYVPSFAARPPALPTPAPASGKTAETLPSPLSVFPPGPAPTPPTGTAAAPAIRGGSGQTVVVLSEELRRRLPADGRELPPVNLSYHAATLNDLLRPAVFRVGVKPEGGAPYVFRETSAGAPVADDRARNYLQRLSFQPATGEEAIVWGQAIFYWGGEAYQ